MEFRLSHPTKEMNRKSLRVLIVGGGVAGSALTLFLKRAGIESALSAGILMSNGSFIMTPRPVRWSALPVELPSRLLSYRIEDLVNHRTGTGSNLHLST